MLSDLEEGYYVFSVTSAPMGAAAAANASLARSPIQLPEAPPIVLIGHAIPDSLGPRANPPQEPNFFGNLTVTIKAAANAPNADVTITNVAFVVDGVRQPARFEVAGPRSITVLDVPVFHGVLVECMTESGLIEALEWPGLVLTADEPHVDSSNEREDSTAWPSFARLAGLGDTNAIPPALLVKNGQTKLALQPTYALRKDGSPSLEEDSPFVEELWEALSGTNSQRRLALFGSDWPFTITWSFVAATADGQEVPVVLKGAVGEQIEIVVTPPSQPDPRVTVTFPSNSSSNRLYVLGVQATIRDSFGATSSVSRLIYSHELASTNTTTLANSVVSRVALIAGETPEEVLQAGDLAEFPLDDPRIDDPRHRRARTLLLSATRAARDARITIPELRLLVGAGQRVVASRYGPGVRFSGDDLTTAHGWRSSDVAKPNDSDGDNVYGTEGYYLARTTKTSQALVEPFLGIGGDNLLTNLNSLSAMPNYLTGLYFADPAERGASGYSSQSIPGIDVYGTLDSPIGSNLNPFTAGTGLTSHTKPLGTNGPLLLLLRRTASPNFRLTLFFGNRAGGSAQKITVSDGDAAETRILTNTNGAQVVYQSWDINAGTNDLQIRIDSLDSEPSRLAGLSIDRLTNHCTLMPSLAVGCPANLLTDCQSPTGTVVNFSFTATNLCTSTDLAAWCDPPPGSSFPIGTTTVNCYAIGNGETAHCSFAITVLPFSERKLTVNDPIPRQELADFGSSVAIDGNTVVAGLYTTGDPSFWGAAYVYDLAGPLGAPPIKLAPADDTREYGFDVAVQGNILVVGAPEYFPYHERKGSAYVYARVGATWVQEAKLTASDGGTDDSFGISVAVDGNTIVVGAIGNGAFGTNTGAAYVFVRGAAGWTEQAKLTPDDAGADTYIGNSVAISGDTVVVGAPGNYQAPASAWKAGKAYVFTRAGTRWTQQQSLVSPDSVVGDTFGYAVAVDGDDVLVGAPNFPPRDTLSRSAYVFSRSAGVWSMRQKLQPVIPSANELFGLNVAIRGGSLAVGSPGLNGAQDSAFVYIWNGSTWAPGPRLSPTDGVRDRLFGRDVALDGSRIAVGALRDLHPGSTRGSVYVYERCITNPICLEVQCPANLVVNCQNANGANVSFDFAATNVCSAHGVVSRCSPAPGGFFPIGTCTVVCSATSDGESRECRFTVTVRDECSGTNLPCLTLTCPQGVVRECEGPSGVAVFYSVPATNRCAVNDLAVTCRPPSGSRFPPGVTLVHCVAAGSGQSTQCDFPVTVLGASPDTRHLVAARTIGAAAVAVTATTMTPTNPVPGHEGGTAWSVPGANTLQLKFDRDQTVGETASGGQQRLEVTDLEGQTLAILNFTQNGSGFNAVADYPGLAQPTAKVFALMLTNGLVEFDPNSLAWRLPAALGAEVSVSLSTTGGIAIISRYAIPRVVDCPPRGPILVGTLIWTAEPGVAGARKHLSEVAILAKDLPSRALIKIEPVLDALPTISGRIVDEEGQGVADVGLTAPGLEAMPARSDALGYFRFPVRSVCEVVVVVPAKPGHQFSPAQWSLAAVREDQVIQFVARTPFEQWQLSHWGANTADSIRGPNADPDGDGIPNVMEYAGGTDPAKAEAAPPKLLQVGLVNIDGQTFARLQMDVASNALDLVTGIEVTEDLGAGRWSALPEAPVKVCSGPEEGCTPSPTTHVMIDAVPVEPGRNRFYRPVTYLFPPPPPTPPPGSDHFRLAFYNTQFLPLLPGILGELSTTSDCCEDIPDRALKLAERLVRPEIDIVALAEVFLPHVGETIVAHARPHFPHVVQLLHGPDKEVGVPFLGPIRIPGLTGLMLLSRFPFEPLTASLERFRANPAHLRAESAGAAWLDVAFTNFTQSSGSDAYSSKGAAMVRIRHLSSSRIFAVVFTHLQNGGGTHEIFIRQTQLGQIREMVEALHRDQPDEQVFVVGDFNINGDPLIIRCPDSNREWESLFGPVSGVGADALEGYFKTTLHDAWRDQISDATYPLPLDNMDRGLSESIHDLGNRNPLACSIHYPPGPTARVDHLLTSSGTDPFPLVVQQMALALNFRHGGPYRPVAFGDAGTQELSDHYGIIADINRRAQRSSPQIALPLGPPPTGLVSASLVQGGQLEHPGSMQWYRIEGPGTFTIAVAPVFSSTPAFQADVFDSRCLSIPIQPYRDLHRSMPYAGHFFDGRTYELPAGLFFIRISNLASVFGPSLGQYKLLLRRHEGLTQEDSIVLIPNTEATEMSSDFVIGRELRWYRINTEPADSRRTQRMEFYLIPETAAESHDLKAQSPAWATAPTSGMGSGERRVLVNDVGGPTVFVRVQAGEAAHGHHYAIGWRNNLTVLHGFSPHRTPGPIAPVEIRCLDQLHDDVQYHFPLSVETSADDLNVYLQFRRSNGFLVGPLPGYNPPRLLSPRFDGGQAVAVNFGPIRFLSDESIVVRLIVDGPGLEARDANVVEGTIGALSPEVATYGRERQLLVERDRSPAGDCPDCDARYTFHFYRSHGLGSY